MYKQTTKKLYQQIRDNINEDNIYRIQLQNRCIQLKLNR